MFNFDYITKEDIGEYNLNLPENSDHPYRIFIAGVLVLEKRMHCLI